MKDRLVLSHVALSIGPFLDISELAACERAQIFSPDVFEWLWDAAGKKLLGATPLWNITANHFLENGLRGKQLVSQIESLRRAVIPSKWLKAWIVQTSFCSIKTTPKCTLHPSGFRGGRSIHDIEEYPGPGSAAIAVGANIGQPLIIGMQLAAAGPVNDNLCIGIEAMGCKGSGRMMSISFAPFSGKCFIEYENRLIIQSKALPSVLEVSEGRAWIHVTEKGGIRFFRQFKDGQLEDTGLVPPEWLPNWIQSYFGCIDVWLSDLAVAIDVSVEYSGCRSPTDMPIFDKHGIEIDTTWSMLGNW
mmetsp:Transcript_66010/g.115516  ORF Transcript_66010/g.115516 Transcript_66010/m.115516 type:complete len:303 (+) Transcript_66010:1-909(+)